MTTPPNPNHPPQDANGGPTPPNPNPNPNPYANPASFAAPPTARVLTPAEERNLGMLAHLVPAILLPLSFGTLGFVGSLVIYFLYKDRGPFVRQHAANSLNVQIITAILLILSTILMLALIGFIFYPVILIVATVIHVIGAVKANNGEWWTPPLTPQFVS